MIKGLGIDVTEVDRIKRILDRYGERFINKVLTPKERELMPQGDPVPYVAARFAGKEAGSKALGTGFRRGVHLKNIEITHLPSGQPVITFLGMAAEALERIGAKGAHVSLTHGRDTAAAVVVLED